MEIKLPEYSFTLLLGFPKEVVPLDIPAENFLYFAVEEESHNGQGFSISEDLLDSITQRLKNLQPCIVRHSSPPAPSKDELLQLARRFNCPMHAIVYSPDREKHNIKQDGFQEVVYFSPQEQCSIKYQPLPCNYKNEEGPFDIIGDVHGCWDELKELLTLLGHKVSSSGAVTLKNNRRIVFVGDLVDRGPSSPKVLKVAMDMVAAGSAFCVPGNHDDRLLRKLKGNKVKVSHGLDITLEQLAKEPSQFSTEVQDFLFNLPDYIILDHGNLVIAHAGLKGSLHGRYSKRVKAFALYGDTSGEKDQYGLPIRKDWAQGYNKDAMVVYGHTPIRTVKWVNNTINLDTGCVFGGGLTALRYPEKEIVTVPAKEEYFVSARPF